MRHSFNFDTVAELSKTGCAPCVVTLVGTFLRNFADNDGFRAVRWRICDSRELLLTRRTNSAEFRYTVSY